MTTDNTVEFTPQGKSTTIITNLMVLVVIDAIVLLSWLLPSRHNYSVHPPFWIAIVIALCLDAVLIMVMNNDVRITIIKANATLQYDYANFFGIEKSKVIDLTTAYYEYKTNTSKSGQRMRLLVYNNYLSNRIAITAGEKTGFSEEQLDAVVKQIKAIRGEY